MTCVRVPCLSQGFHHNDFRLKLGCLFLLNWFWYNILDQLLLRKLRVFRFTDKLLLNLQVGLQNVLILLDVLLLYLLESKVVNHLSELVVHVSGLSARLQSRHLTIGLLEKTQLRRLLQFNVMHSDSEALILHSLTANQDDMILVQIQALRVYKVLVLFVNQAHLVLDFFSLRILIQLNDFFVACQDAELHLFTGLLVLEAQFKRIRKTRLLNLNL